MSFFPLLNKKQDRLKDITSGVGIKRALKQGAKRAGKSILKRGTQRIMQGKGRTRNIVRKRKREQNPSTALSMLLKSINSPKRNQILIIYYIE